MLRAMLAARLPVMPAAALAVLALLALLAARPAVAEGELIPVVVAAFGESEPQVRLLRAAELELQLVEELVVSDDRDLRAELGSDDVAGADPERLADALARLEQQALVYAVPPPYADGELIIAVFRTNDAAVVFARLIDVGEALQRPGAALTRDLAEAVRTLHTRERLGDDELAALGLRSFEPAAPEEPAAPPEEPAPEEPAPEEPPPADAPAPALAGELGRFAVTLSPTFLYYRACQPADPKRTAPFACTSREDTPDIAVLIDPLSSPVAAEAHLELTPLPWLALEARGSALYARLQAATRGQRLEALSPNPFAVLAGHGLLAASLRLPFGSPELGGAAGLRAGYHLAWAFADEQVLEVGARRLKFPLLPSYASHHALLGGSAVLAVGDALRFTLDVDGLLGPHLEGPNRVGASALALGGRAHLGFDVRLLLGLYASFFLDVSALSVGTSGVFEQAPRYTLALEPFDSGQVLLAFARAGIGLGWRF